MINNEKEKSKECVSERASKKNYVNPNRVVEYLATGQDFMLYGDHKFIIE